MKMKEVDQMKKANPRACILSKGEEVSSPVDHYNVTIVQEMT